MKNYYRVDSGPLVMIYDTAMKEIDPLEMDEEAMGELLNYQRQNGDFYEPRFLFTGPKVPTLRGNLNLTVEDDIEWDPSKYLRICFQIYNKDRREREMIRFVNLNPVGGEANFVHQFTTDTYLRENGLLTDDDLQFFCSRPHNWEGIIKETGEYTPRERRAKEQKLRPYMEDQAPSVQEVTDGAEEKDDDGAIWQKKETTTRFSIDKPDQISGVHMGSQHQFMDHKNDGIGADYLPTRWWWKKSAHVTFRRPMVVNSDKTLDLSTDDPLYIYLQWGLFDSLNDDNESAVFGDLDLSKPQKLYLPPIVFSKALFYQVSYCFGALMVIMAFN